MISLQPRFTRPAYIPRKYCVACGERLPIGATSDRCVPRSVQRNCECGNDLSRDNVSGVCQPCILARTKVARDLADQRAIESLCKLRSPFPIGTARQVIAYVSEIFDIPVKDILGPRQFIELVHARSSVVMVLRNRGTSYPRIGCLIGGRDHSTIVNLHHKFEKYASLNPLVRKSVDAIEAALASVALPVSA